MAEHFDTVVAAGRILVRSENPEQSISAVRSAATGELSPLLDVAVSHGMLPILCRVLETHASDVMTERSRALVAHERDLAGARALAAIAQLSEVLDALEREGIRAMPIKGPLLSLDAYGDAALRSSDDIDVLVDPADVDRAWTALQAIGYRAKDGWTWRRWRAANAWQGQVPLYGAGEGLTLDLHWRTCDEKLPWNLPVGDLFARARTIDVARREVLQPEILDQFILVLLHAARHAWDRLEHLVCASAFVRQGVDQEALVRRLGLNQGVPACLGGIAAMTQLFVDAPENESIAGDHRGQMALARVRLGDRGSSRDGLAHLATLRSPRSMARYAALALLQPTVPDFEAVRLPRAFEFAYPLVRVGRLATNRLLRGLE